MTILLPEEMQTQAESLSLRFRTNKPNGLLLTTSHSYLDDHFMTLSLESGSIRLDFNYGDTQMERIGMVDQKLNDDQWHTIHLERRGPNLEITIDQTTKQVVELTGQHFTLHISAIHIGARLNIHKSHRKSFDFYFCSKNLMSYNVCSFFCCCSYCSLDIYREKTFCRFHWSDAKFCIQ